MARNFEDIVKELEEIPLTWIPVLLSTLVKTAIKKKVFQYKRISVFVKNIEDKEIWPTTPE